MANKPIDLPSAAESLKCGSLRVSKRGVLRASVLIAVYAAIILHIVHWKVAGRTVTPVEPSEAMQTLELGYVNAGIILFVLLILSTLVFGRFFCGWGCHVVALQDLCGWGLKKFGMKPKAFRSRLLVFIPLFAAFYMFVLPTLMRLLEGRAFPGLTFHLTTENFWATFPTPGIAILTFLVCGFLIVWLVGNKGFCTYGCPYGAFFFYADKVAPGKIRVTDDCEQCGHCTATCTSNVRVHEEVARFGMVVDAGCMKCMDCVSVCPKNALYYGFGKTALRVRPSTPAPAKRYDFTWPEEIAMAAVFLSSLYALRGLYDAVPLLLAIGLAAISAFLAVAVGRLFYRSDVRWQRLQLRRDGGLTAVGFGAAVLCAAWFAFVVHSGVWNYHFHEGNRLYAGAMSSSTSDEAARSAQAAAVHYEWCAGNGFFAVSTLEAGIGSAYAFTGDLEKGAEHLSRAVELGPGLDNAWVQLGRTQAALGRADEAIATYKTALLEDLANFEASHQLGALLSATGKPQEALSHLERALKRMPTSHSVLTDYGLALARAGRPEDAIAPLEKATANGDSAPARFNLGLVQAELGRMDVARKSFTSALVHDPMLLPAKVALARLELLEGDTLAGKVAAESALAQSPYEPQALQLWAEALVKRREIDAEIAKLIKSRSDDEVSWYRAAYLYQRKGDASTARALYQRLQMRNPNLPPLG